MKKILFVSALMLSGLAQADHYGEAGCGLGSMLMGADGNQVFAATTNDISRSNMFGISFGTSNCTEDGAMASNQELDLFVESNQVALAKESARGEGESIRTLAKVMGCGDSAQLGATLQAQYAQVFPSQDVSAVQVTESLRSLARDSLSCHNVL